MSIGARAVALFGLYFVSRRAAIEFVQRNGHPDVEELDYDADEDYMEGLVLVCLNPFSGTGYLMGYELKLGETLDGAKAKWSRVFPNSDKDPEAHLEVSYF